MKDFNSVKQFDSFYSYLQFKKQLMYREVAKYDNGLDSIEYNQACSCARLLEDLIYDYLVLTDEK